MLIPVSRISISFMVVSVKNSKKLSESFHILVSFPFSNPPHFFVMSPWLIDPTGPLKGPGCFPEKTYI